MGTYPLHDRGQTKSKSFRKTRDRSQCFLVDNVYSFSPRLLSNNNEPFLREFQELYMGGSPTLVDVLLYSVFIVPISGSSMISTDHGSGVVPRLTLSSCLSMTR